jgi:Bacterial type II and III secretion system protein/FG-GAP-like repeat
MLSGFAGPARGQSPAPSRGPQPATATAPAPPRAPLPSPRKAKEFFEQGRRAEQAGHWQEAFEAYAQAFLYASANREYLLRRELARSRLVQEHADRAEGDAAAGNLEAARRELERALALDPTDTIVQERLAQIGALASPPIVREIPPKLSGEIRLQPEPGTRNFDYRGDTMGAYIEVARQFGVKTAFDVDLHPRSVRLHVAGVNFETVMQMLGDMTQTFWRPLTAKMFFVAEDTQQKRKDYEASVVRTVQLLDSATPDQMTEMLRTVREIAGITRADLDVRSRTITMRDSPQVISLAVQLISGLEKPPAELLLEIEILEVNRDAARKLGITPPEKSKLLSISRQDLLEAQQSAQGLIDVLTRLFGQPSSLSGLSASQIASLVSAGQVSLGSLIPPLVAFGGGKTTFLATMPGALASFSDALSLVRSGRRILLRAQDGRPATFFVGDRIPISLALFSPSLGGTSISTSVAGNTFPRTDVAVGAMPVSIAVADFNEDGHPDLAVLNQADHSVSILLGNGDGTFQSQTVVSLPPGSNPTAVVAADFNGDKHLDLAVADQTTDKVSILLGNGDGTFQPETHFDLPAGSGPSALVTADFNGDSIPDLALADAAANNIVVLLGNGDGTFTLKSSPVAGKNPIALIAADFDKDGRQDLAVVNQQDNTIATLLGNGDGTFQPITAATTFATGNTPTSLATADFNGDSNLDLVVTNFADNTVSVFPGNGDGTFLARTDTPTAAGPSSAAIGDFNFDGRQDIVVTNQTGNTSSVFLGLGDGTFAARLDLPVGNAPVDIVASDLNGDGRLDIITANSTAGTATIILNSTVFTPAGAVPQTPFPGAEYVDIGLKVKATPRVHLNDEVTLQLQFEISSLTGANANGIPIISNRMVEQSVRLRQDETSVLAGILERDEMRAINGNPGLAQLSGPLLSNRSTETADTELLILVTPRLVRVPASLGQTIYAGPGRSTSGAGRADRP